MFFYFFLNHDFFQPWAAAALDPFALPLVSRK